MQSDGCGKLLTAPLFTIFSFINSAAERAEIPAHWCYANWLVSLTQRTSQQSFMAGITKCDKLSLFLFAIVTHLLFVWVQARQASSSTDSCSIFRGTHTSRRFNNWLRNRDTNRRKSMNNITVGINTSMYRCFYQENNRKCVQFFKKNERERALINNTCKYYSGIVVVALCDFLRALTFRLLRKCKKSLLFHHFYY